MLYLQVKDSVLCNQHLLQFDNHEHDRLRHGHRYEHKQYNVYRLKSKYPHLVCIMWI